jgi:hypothetical protein
MKTVIILTLTTFVVAMSGCTSTVTLGPKANESAVIGVTAGTDGASLTLPLVRGEVSPTTTTKKKK